MMVRPRPTSLLLLLFILPALLATGACGGSEEQALLSKYFQASRMRDNTTLANIATVSFSPTENGIVQGFDVVTLGEEQKVALKLRELKAAEEEARKADEAFNKEKRAYQDANLEAIERVLKAERENTKLRGKDLEVQTAWTKWRTDSQEYAGKLAAARQALAAERGVAEISVFDARNAVDPTQFDGDLITRDMVVKAKVKKGEADPVEEDLHVRFQRVDLRNGPEGKAAQGRWVITHVGHEKPHTT
jgi:hypothetical protein